MPLMPFVMRLMGALALTFVSASVWSADFVEGTHYERLPISVETADKSKVEVVEVFSYACVHCFNFAAAFRARIVRTGSPPKALTCMS